MNIILFSESEIHQPLPRSDRRAVHILTVLRAGTGDTFHAALIDGPKGIGRVKDMDNRHLFLEFRFEREVDTLYPVGLITGLTRPQTMKKVLQDATALGVSGIMVTGTELGEKSYKMSKLWTRDEYKRHIQLGAEQAFSSKLPELKRYHSLKKCLEDLRGGDRIAFDNYEKPLPLCELPLDSNKCYIAIGSERGWTPGEIGLLKDRDFRFASLGKRILRTETACTSAITLILNKMGLI